MKCINKRVLAGLLIVSVLLSVTGCGKAKSVVENAYPVYGESLSLIHIFVNIKEYNTAAGTASDILIPIDDVYFALINNNVLDLNHFSAEDASDVEKQIFSAFGSKQQTVLSQVESSLSSSAATPVDELPEEMQD